MYLYELLDSIITNICIDSLEYQLSGDYWNRLFSPEDQDHSL